MIPEEELEEKILTSRGEKVGKGVVMPTQVMKFKQVELNFMPESHELGK